MQPQSAESRPPAQIIIRWIGWRLCSAMPGVVQPPGLSQGSSRGQLDRHPRHHFVKRYAQRKHFTLVIACTPGNWTETERCRPFLLVELGFARDAESVSLGARTWTPAWKPISSGHKKADP